MINHARISWPMKYAHVFHMAVSSLLPRANMGGVFFCPALNHSPMATGSKTIKHSRKQPAETFSRQPDAE